MTAVACLQIVSRSSFADPAALRRSDEMPAR